MQRTGRTEERAASSRRRNRARALRSMYLGLRETQVHKSPAQGAGQKWEPDRRGFAGRRRKRRHAGVWRRQRRAPRTSWAPWSDRQLELGRTSCARIGKLHRRSESAPKPVRLCAHNASRHRPRNSSLRSRVLYVRCAIAGRPWPSLDPGDSEGDGTMLRAAVPSCATLVVSSNACRDPGVEGRLTQLQTSATRKCRPGGNPAMRSATLDRTSASPPSGDGRSFARAVTPLGHRHPTNAPPAAPHRGGDQRPFSPAGRCNTRTLRFEAQILTGGGRRRQHNPHNARNIAHDSRSCVRHCTR